MLALFDFPNPNNTSEQRSVTLGPMQRLYFMNNEFVAQAWPLPLPAGWRRPRRMTGNGFAQAYRLAFGRLPTEQEIQMGKDFLRATGGVLAAVRAGPA